jgi:hypothetical protein
MNDPSGTRSPALAGMSGALRLIVAAAVVLLAALATLAVFDLLPEGALREWSVKLLLAAGIAGTSAVALGALLRGGTPR